MEEGVPIESRLISKQIERAQSQVEARNFDIRKHLLEYDDVMNVQRKWIYGRRLAALERESIQEEVLELDLGGLHRHGAGRPDRGHGPSLSLTSDPARPQEKG